MTIFVNISRIGSLVLQLTTSAREWKTKYLCFRHLSSLERQTGFSDRYFRRTIVFEVAEIFSSTFSYFLANQDRYNRYRHTYQNEGYDCCPTGSIGSIIL